MVGQKLIKILQSLEPGEFKRLKRALSSPYFATNPRLLALYDYLKKYYPEFDESKLQKEKLYKKLYPDNDFNESVLRVLVREFSSVVEDFLIMERLKKNKYERKKLLVSEYGKRNLYDLFKKGTVELLSDLNDDHIRDTEYFKGYVELYQDYCFHPMTNNNNVSDDSIEHLAESLDSYFVMAKYRLTQILRNRNSIIKQKVGYRYFDMIEKSSFGLVHENKIIELYRLVNKLHDTNDRKVFVSFEKMFFPVINRIRNMDLRVIYYLGLNYCIRQFNMGKVEYLQDQFDWYNIGIDNKLLVEDEKMSHVTFNNIVTVACYLNEFEWAFNFIEQNKKFLGKEIKDDAINYTKSVICVYQYKFEDAYSLLSNHSYKSELQLSKRSLTIRAVFELFRQDSSYYTSLQSQIESSKKFISRNKMFSERRIQANNNYFKIVEKLSKKMWENERKRAIRNWLAIELEKEKNIVSKKWLKDLSKTI